MNLYWAHWGSGSQETKNYCESINKVHAGVWNRVPGAFSFAWEAQAAIILLSWYESYMRRTVGAKKQYPVSIEEGMARVGRTSDSSLQVGTDEWLHLVRQQLS